MYVCMFTTIFKTNSITSLNIINHFFLVGFEYLPFCGNASFEIPALKLYIEVQINPLPANVENMVSS